MFEVELKYCVTDLARTRERISAIGGHAASTCEHRDTYLNHPCRDFRVTGEALRIRRIDGVPMVTYKSAVDPGHAGQAKARQEFEWRLDPGDGDGTLTESLFANLGFEVVATVEKQRTTFQVAGDVNPPTITLDHLNGIGWFVEIECVLPVAQPSEVEVSQARHQVQLIADRLGLSSPEPRSYLRIMLESLD